MKRSALTLAVLVSLAYASPALAAKHHKRHKAHQTVVHASTDPTTLALTLAERYWGSVPCGGIVNVESASTVPTLESVPVSKEDSEIGVEPAMWTAFQTPNGPNDFSAPYATDSACVITINNHAWPNWHADDENFQEYCDNMTHEVGHLFGHDDLGQTNPASIEYPVLGFTTPNYDSVPECRGITLWYGDEAMRDPSEAESQCEQARSRAAERRGKGEWVSCYQGP